MAIWRGTGGSGESTSDSTINITTTLANQAAASAAAALVSENAAEAAQAAAQTAETNAETAETNAATSATNAASSATAAASSATSAASSASSASTSASTATTKASEASTSASSAATSASSASTSASTATTKAAEASSSATAAASSATSASSSATAASSSASAAATSATNAATSATSAATSASTATTQASNASFSASSAASSATAAAASATTASTQASAASTSATNAASSASSAATSASTATTQASNASTSATNAAASASTASTQATNAAASATTASTQASNASTSATNAASSASSASTSASNAASSAASAAAALDSFDDRYLGSKTSDPTLDNDGNALLVGALYYNSTTQAMKVYDGANWIAASAAGSASMNVYKYIATNGQTTFSGAAAVGGTMSYTSGNIIVFLNGASLDSTDYTATNGTSVVLAVAARVSDEVVVVAFKSFTVADTYSVTAADALLATKVSLTGNQTVAGIKTFSSAPVMGVTGLTGDIDAARIVSALNASGSAPVFACRAWVNFNGTGTVAINASGNVSSITDNGTGDYTVNFTNAMPDANYSQAGFARSTGGIGDFFISTTLTGTKSTSQFRIYVRFPTGASDSSEICCNFFR